jgi:nicotinamidase/pyrazinamidase
MLGKWGVIVTDMQGDFTEWKKGSLAVAGSDEGYVANVERATRRLKELGLPIFGTQDWHPPNHVSFYTSHPGKKPLDTIEIRGRSQVLWPPHCVQGTENARILIDNNLFLAVVRKAQDPALESYSAFKDEVGDKTEMETVLRMNGVDRFIIYGIATDYCVRATALDGRAAGYGVTVVEDLCRGVSPDTTAAALAEMREKGVKVTPFLDDILLEIMA